MLRKLSEKHECVGMFRPNAPPSVLVNGRNEFTSVFQDRQAQRISMSVNIVGIGVEKPVLFRFKDFWFLLLFMLEGKDNSARTGKCVASKDLCATLVKLRQQSSIFVG